MVKKIKIKKYADADEMGLQKRKIRYYILSTQYFYST